MKKNSARFIYALKNGLGYGLFLFIVFGLFKLGKSPISEVYFSAKALEQLGLFLIGGFLGFFFFGWWAEKGKRG